MLEQVFENLKEYGVDLDDKKETYQLEELKDGLAAIFGLRAAELLMQKIRKDLTESRSKPV